MTELVTFYDPRISTLIDQCDADWGDPTANQARLIPYGITLIDKALYGLDPEGELIIIQGEEKKRKTTLWINVLINIMLGKKPVSKPWINIDVLESGMPPKKYRDALIANLASRFLMQMGHKASGYCPACESGICRELTLSPKFLRYNKRSELQLEVIERAKATIRDWPILIHGTRLDQGNTRNLNKAALGTKKEPARWKVLIDTYGVQVFAEDHLQQYAFPGREMSDYEKQNAVIPTISDFVSQNGVANILISQVSMGSVREVKESGGRLRAAGGAKAAQEANTVFSVDYNHDGQMTIKIEESRDAGNIRVYQKLDDNSGAFYGEATIEPEG